ncbi:hypothetical protein [Pseudoxanthomonas mexicana]|uniref:hypothetical protein n=1 Tax=Pseudoxanthomonas mexicana TaxID=128785 RepID=UPI00209D485F|nr:hypothetical protein [Pseudoxanthomonas mexicana]MCP1582022.1 hypothetical protein [Pseudoxanthomonas mexicana]
MNTRHHAIVVLLALVGLGSAGCDRRDDPSVDGDSKVVSSPPGEIVDTGPDASAQADRMPRYRTPDRPACAGEGRDDCDEREDVDNNSQRTEQATEASRREP